METSEHLSVSDAPDSSLSAAQNAKGFACAEQASVGERLFVTLLQVSDALQRDVASLLRDQADLTMVQYNVLRILRGAGEAGQTCAGIGERLITHDPDVTRLIDRMQRRGLVHRGRDLNDRRVVRVHLTAQGRTMVDELDQPVAQFHQQRYCSLSADQQSAMITALQKLESALTS